MGIWDWTGIYGEPRVTRESSILSGGVCVYGSVFIADVETDVLSSSHTHL